MIDKNESYKILCRDVLKCERCDLGCEKLLDGHNPRVNGQGNLNTKIMFIAEAPGLQETVFSRPLSPPGVSGVIYEKVLETLGMKREEVYTTNTVLCRPPKNRDPEVWEIHKCKQYLKKQIEIVQPKIIVTFGRFAAQSFVNDFKITRDHGKLQKSEQFDISIFPLYHPAYIGAYAPKEKRVEFDNAVKSLKNILENYDGIFE